MVFEFSSVPKVFANYNEMHGQRRLGKLGTQLYSDVGADDDIDDDSDAHDDDNDNDDDDDDDDYCDDDVEDRCN